MAKHQEQTEKQQRSLQAEEAPDGGWGWVVVGVLFTSSALVFGLIRSLGVFFVEFVQYFEESAQAVSWITSIGVAMQQLLSPAGTAACNAYGARPVVMMGGFLSGLGLILASQAATLTHLYLTMGVISGTGWALVFTPTIASVMQYFTCRRSLAMGLGFTGVGLSSFAFSPLFQYLVETYTWRGALLILGGLSLNIVACGALIRPLGAPRGMATAECSSGPTGCVSLISRACEYFELSLLSRRGFLTYSLAVTCFNAGYFIPYVHLVAHSRLVGFSEYQAAFLISATGVTDIVGRVVSGWASDLRRVRLLHMLAIWSGLLGLFLPLLPVCSLGRNYGGLLVVSLAYGFCAGAMTPLVFAVVPEIVGMERMLGALGLLQLIESTGGLLGAPLSGWLKDLTGSYTGSFVVAGGFLILGTMIMATLPRFWSCANFPPPSPKKKVKNECVEDKLLKQPLSSDSDQEKSQSIDDMSFSGTDLETNAHQNHSTEPVTEVGQTTHSADRTEGEVAC
ncbi:monocarboxylate transporter 13 [Brachyhypopomus gauderio]|uniref:monocarboxylate transporter 13 n=1 Tax=Brachyhypopomus gauderio TaxID=698409 RepID=UPI0040420EF1